MNQNQVPELRPVRIRVTRPDFYTLLRCRVQQARSRVSAALN